MNFTFNERNSAWNKSILGGFFFKFRFWNAEPIYSIARVSDHVLRPRHSTWCLAVCDIPRLRYFICVLISHNIWCCVVIGIKESVCIIGLSWLQKVIREQIVSTKCKKPKESILSRHQWWVTWCLEGVRLVGGVSVFMYHFNNLNEFHSDKSKSCFCTIVPL